MDFGFNLNDVQVNSGNKRLAPWNIYDVKFKGCEVVEFKGTKDPTQTYKVLRTRFENESGYYEESTFFPRPEDAQRRKYTNKEGHESEMPSNWELTKTFIAQLVGTLNPEGFKKMQELSSKFKSFDDMAKAVVALTDKVKDKETKIKLVGRTRQDGTVEARIPRIAAVNKDGQLWTCDNFIGNNLSFSPYEERARAQFQNAKPTPMPEVAATTSTADDGFNLSDLAELV